MDKIIDAWMAGFFDGDGCVFINRQLKQPNIIHTLHVSVTQKHKQILKFIQNIYGGGISETNGYYIWYLTGKNTVFFLKRIQKYLHVKSNQVKLALDFEELRIRTHSKKLSINDVAQRDAYHWAIRKAKRYI